MGNTQFDFFLLLLISVIIMLGVVSTILNPQKYSIKNPRATIRSGLLLMIFAIVFNSAKENRWSIGDILSFVCLKKVSHGNYLRQLLALSYIPIIWGCLQLLFDRKSNSQKNV